MMLHRQVFEGLDQVRRIRGQDTNIKRKTKRNKKSKGMERRKQTVNQTSDLPIFRRKKAVYINMSGAVQECKKKIN